MWIQLTISMEGDWEKAKELLPAQAEGVMPSVWFNLSTCEKILLGENMATIFQSPLPGITTRVPAEAEALRRYLKSHDASALSEAQLQLRAL